MKIVIDIPDEMYDWYLNGFPDENDAERLWQTIKDGTPLPKGHGAIKDVSQIEIPMCEDRTYERWVQVAINAAPTIIEADMAESEGV